VAEPHRDSFAACDRRQRRQLAVFAGQGQQIRRLDRRRDDLDQRLPGTRGGASNSTASIPSCGTGPRRSY
jgi:hypothetical protein